MQSDNGTEFVNEVVSCLVKEYKIDHRLISEYHPQANGLVERAIGIFLNNLKKTLMGDSFNWSSNLPSAQLAMNNRISSFHASSPFTILFARKLNPFSDFKKSQVVLPSKKVIDERLNFVQAILFPSVAKKATNVVNARNESWNQSHRLCSHFKEGSVVAIRNLHKQHKLDVDYLGPYKIVRRTQGGAYKLMDATGKVLERRFPPNLLKFIDCHDFAEGFYVEKIIDDKIVDGKQYFLVRWYGYSPESDSWEQASAFDDPLVIERYFKRKKNLGGSDCYTLTIKLLIIK